MKVNWDRLLLVIVTLWGLWGLQIFCTRHQNPQPEKQQPIKAEDNQMLEWPKEDDVSAKLLDRGYKKHFGFQHEPRDIP